MAAGLAASGVQVEEEPEGMVVLGVRGGNHDVAGGATVRTHGDHRIAMSFLVLGLAAREPVRVDEPGMIATSFPGFTELMAGLGATLGLPVLDTGLLYRAVGVALTRSGGDLDDAAAAGRVALGLDPGVLDDAALRSREAGEAASQVAVHREVRDALLAFQRAF